MTTIRGLPLLVGCASIIASGALAQEPESEVVQPSESEMFWLYTHCQPVDFTIILDDEVTELFGAKGKALAEAAVESRLRAAKLYVSEGSYYAGPRLIIEIDVVGAAFSIHLELYQTLYNFIRDGVPDFTIIQGGLVLPNVGRASTWSLSILGIHAGDATFIRSQLSGPIDVFLANYLRVNETAC